MLWMERLLLLEETLFEKRLTFVLDPATFSKCHSSQIPKLKRWCDQTKVMVPVNVNGVRTKMVVCVIV